jgi:phosphate uptake regulator
MGNVPIHRRLVRRLTKNSSGTLSVSIPIEHAMVLGWKKGDYVQVERRKSVLVVAAIKVTRKR